MIKCFCLVLGAFLISLTKTANAQSIAMEPAWQSDTTLRVPERILFDADQKMLYVPCVKGKATLANKVSFIAKVGLDGKVTKLKFADGLNAIKVMAILTNKLYVTEMTQTDEILLTTGKILNW